MMIGRCWRFTPSSDMSARMPPSPSLSTRIATDTDLIVVTTIRVQITSDWNVFTGLDDLEFDPNTPLIQLFLPWFFHCWAPDPLDTKVVNKSLHDVIPTKAYLATKGRRLDPLVRRYLESLLTAPLTFFEVLACDPGTGMTLRHVMTHEGR